MRWRLLGVLALVLPSVAAGQYLDLGEPAPPDPALGSAAVDAAGLVEAQAGRLEDDDPAAAVRELIGAMFRTGDALGEAGSVHVLTARTMLNRLGGLDTALVDRDLIGAFEAELLAADVRALAADVPADVTELDRRLRNVFAPVVNGFGALPDWMGWLEDPALSGGVDVDAAMATLRSLPDGAVAGDLIGVLERGLSSSAHRRSAASTLAVCERAAGVYDEQPRWVPGSTTDELRVRFVEAAAGLLDRERSVAAMGSLRALGAAADAIRLAEELPNTNEARAVRETLRTRLSRSGDLPAAMLDGLNIAMELVIAEPPADVEDALVRQLRPAWRARADDLAASRRQLLGRLPLAATQRDPLTDPSVLSAIGARRETLETVDDLLALNELLIDADTAARRPEVMRTRKRLADRLLIVGRGLDDDRRAASTRQMLADFARDVRLYREMPGEAGLRAAVMNGDGSVWLKMLGARAGLLLEEIDAARDAWIAAWEKATAGGVDDEPTARLAALRALMIALDDARRAGAGNDSPSLKWAGWEIAPAVLKAEVSRTNRGLSAMVDAALAGEDGELREGLRGARTRSVVLELHGVIERGLERVRPVDEEGLPGGLDAVALGPPSERAWMAAWRPELAAVCRYADDWYTARAGDDPQRVAQLREVIESRATRVLEAIGD